jgi:CHAT domain-containing protein
MVFRTGFVTKNLVSNESKERSMSQRCSFAMSILLLATLSPPTHGQDAEDDKVVKRQADLWQSFNGLCEQKKFPEALTALEQLIHLQREAFGDVSSTMAYLIDLRCDVEGDAKVGGRDRSHGASGKSLWIRCRLGSFMPAEKFNAEEIAARRKTCERLERVLTLREKAFGQIHLWAALGAMDSAWQRQQADKRPEAAQGWEHALRMIETLADAKNTPDFRQRRLLINLQVDARQQLARLRWREGNAAEAEKLIGQNLKTVSDAPKVWDWRLQAEMLLANRDTDALARLPWGTIINTASGLSGNASHDLSEMEHYQVATAMHVVLDYYLSFRAQQGQQGSAEPLAAGISNFKGSVFIEQSRRRAERRHPKLAHLYQELDETNRQLSVLLSPTGGGKTDQVQELLERRTKREVELAQLRLLLPRYMNPPVWMQLPAGVVLLDFYEYYDFSAGSTWAPARRLACLVCRNLKKAPVVFVDLGPAEPVANAVQGWRNAIQARKGLGLSANGKPSDQDELRKLVWEHLVPLVKDATTVLVSPDGVLSFVPFAALPGSKPGSVLLEDYPLAYVPAPHLLTPFKSKTAPVPKLDKDAPAVEPRGQAERMLLIGGVDYDVAEKTLPSARPAMHFKLLPGTSKEVDDVAALHKKTFPDGAVVNLQGKLASKDAFRQEAPTCRWIHLATHGFFRPQSGNPLAVGSGLALAGANSPEPAAAANGLLMSLEVSGLDLGGVELTVLSACETSMGDVQRGEGVRGLQSAFQLAGAQTTVTSLWSVPDEATRVMMERFYANLWDKSNRRSKLEALREAQLWMLREGRRSPDILRGAELEDVAAPEKDGRLPPYYWAAFVLSGDWR